MDSFYMFLWIIYDYYLAKISLMTLKEITKTFLQFAKRYFWIPENSRN